MRRQFLIRAAAFGAAALAAPWASAQAAYPDKPIRFIVPFPPGPGGIDQMARIVGQKMSETLGQPIIIDNRVGGNTAIAAGFVAKAPPDGYNVLFTAASTHVIHTIQANLPYDSVKDFQPVGSASMSGYMMAIHPSVPAKTLPEFIAYAKANPGKLNFASAGVGNANHLAGELFNISAGTQITHVPYKGGGPALLDLLAGRVQMMVTNVGVLQQQVDAGALRALAYTSQLPGKPPVPLFSQYGLADVGRVESVSVILAPVGTPAPIVARLSGALQQALRTPEVKQVFDSAQQEPFYENPTQLGERLRGDRARFEGVIQKADIKLNP